MSYFTYRNNQLYVEEVPVATIAERFGTPCYLYSRAAIEQQWQAFTNALAHYPHQICYAVKANGNIAESQTLSNPRFARPTRATRPFDKVGVDS